MTQIVVDTAEADGWDALQASLRQAGLSMRHTYLQAARKWDIHGDTQSSRHGTLDLFGYSFARHHYPMTLRPDHESDVQVLLDLARSLSASGLNVRLVVACPISERTRRLLKEAAE